jgi:hypothetical protein
MANQNDATNVGIVPDGMIFLARVGTTTVRPTSSTSVPGDGVTQIGYYSEDGYTLTPNPGDSSDFNAHNGDIVDTSQDPGSWAAQFSAIESKKAVVEAYFDAVVNLADASITLSKASTDAFYELWAIAIRKDGSQVLKFFPKVRVSDRDAITYNRSTLIGYGMTFTTYPDPASDPLLDENAKRAHVKIFDPKFLVS